MNGTEPTGASPARLPDASEPIVPGLGTEDQLVEELLVRFNSGDFTAREDLFRLVASELHSLARREMRNQPDAHTLQATALMNEAYLKLFGREPTACRDKQHLLRAAGRAMHQVLQDHARAKLTRKRGDAGRRVELGSAHGGSSDEPVTSFLEFSEEVRRLARVSPDMARAMELRYLLGFKMEEIAGILQMKFRTFEREFAAASALLAARLR
jgi:RNA polymerase sigma factor (TIGR02999 family)